MSPNLPSQKLFILFIPIIVFFGIFVMVKQKTPNQVKNTSSVTPNIVSVKNTIINAVDTDSDGVPDWEEIIWKTDPNKPNTYEIPDRDYITKKSAEAKNNPQGTSTVNATAELSHQLFSEYMSLQNAGQLNNATIQSLTSRLADTITTTVSAKIFTEKDVTTFPDSDTTKLEGYANTLMGLENKYLALYKKSTDTKNLSVSGPRFSETMGNASKFYVSFAQELQSVRVPESVVALHVAYINSLEGSAEGLLALSHYKNDPVQALSGVQKHTQSESDQTSILGSITSFLVQNGILNVNLASF